jgi:hypothetical protein
MKKFSQRRDQPNLYLSAGDKDQRNAPIKVKNPYDASYEPKPDANPFETIEDWANDKYLYDESLSKSKDPVNIGENFFYEPTSAIRNEYLESLKALEKQAKDLKNSSQYSDTKKTLLTQEIFDHNPFAIQVELERIEKIIPSNQKTFMNYYNEETEIVKYKAKLKDQLQKLKSKFEYEDLETSSSIMGSAGRVLNVKPSENLNEATGRRDLESLERLIRARQENIADIESYIFGLVTGVDQFSAFASNIAHTNAKFIKISKDHMVKESDEVIEDYYNELYEDSEGSPDFGTALEHPKETRDELSTNIHRHRFKKK